MTEIVVYLRTSGLDSIASTQALDEQRARLAGWSATNVCTVLQEFLEIEGNEPGRPRLAEAIAACRSKGASLVIVSTQPIGEGRSFAPRVASVPVIVLPPQTIACPSVCRKGVCLWVGPMTDDLIPLYLCNPQDIPLRNVIVRGSGLYLGTRNFIPTCSSSNTVLRVAPQTAELIEVRNAHLEGEFLDALEIEFDEGEVIGMKGIAVLRNLLDRRSPIKINRTRRQD